MVKAAGHRIGNHTYNHLGGFTTSTRSYVRNVHKADELIHSNLFRPPHGWLRHLQYHFLKRHFKLVMWDVVTRDYSKRLNADEVFENVKQAYEGKEVPLSPKQASKEELEAFMLKALPDYDADRVYQNDIRKVITWYNILVHNGITDFVTPEEKPEEKKD